MIRQLSTTTRFTYFSYFSLIERSMQMNQRKALKRNFLTSSETKLDQNKMPRKENNGQSQSTDVQVLPTPIKSESDKKEYRIVKLHNGLTALLIDSRNAVSHNFDAQNEVSSASEADTDAESEGEDDEEALAACSLTVSVGSFSDPRKIQGLAHFLEHMIFMGSEKYPVENELDAFVTKAGGSSNADTGSEETSFYFDVRETYIEQALDRFSNLFISPLMHRDTMDREKEAVDSEFQQKINAESSRREQILASMGNPEHPCSLFTWGNLVTLKESIDDDQLYRDVHEFRRRHYSAHRMYVAIQARKNLDELQNLVKKYFDAIPTNQLPGLDFSAFNHTNAFLDGFRENVFYVKAKSDVNRLNLTWCLPPIGKKYKTKPDELVSVLIGHEGKGSLCSYLRRHLLALEVQAGIDSTGFDDNSMFSLYTIDIVLTEKGLQDLDRVMKAVFSYLRLLEKETISHEKFKEMQQIEINRFKFQTENQAIDNVENLVVHLKYYEPQDVLGGPTLYYEFNEESIREVITHLNTRNFNVMLTTKIPCTGIEYDKKEKWFGTDYGVLPFPKPWIDIWNSKEILSEMHLPERNEFIPTQFEILPGTTPNPIYPELVIDTTVVKLWHRQDNKFLLPHAFMNFYFINDMSKETTRNASLLNLCSIVLRYYLIEKLYPATISGVTYNLYAAESGLVLKLNGFNEKMPKILSIITKLLSEFSQKMEETVVKAMKEQLLKNSYNGFIQTKTLNREVRLHLIQDVYHPSYLKYQEMASFTSNDLRLFLEEFLSQLKIVGIIQGNVSKAQVATIGTILQENLNPQPVEKSIEKRTKQIPFGSKYICIKSLRKNDVNTVVTNYYQHGLASIKLTAYLDLLVSLMEEPSYDQLRTKEQLGYDVSVQVRDTYNILGFTMTIRSQENKFKSFFVDEKIEEFLTKFEDILANMPIEDFETAKDSLIKLKSMPDTELKEEVDRNWAEIIEEEYIFDRRFKEVEQLKSISKQKLLDFYKNLMNEGGKRKLSIHIVGDETIVETNANDEEDLLESVTLKYLEHKDSILNIEEYKATLESYPVTKTLLE